MTNEQLAIRIKAGIDVADNMLALWQQNRGFIHKIVNQYRAYADANGVGSFNRTWTSSTERVALEEWSWEYLKRHGCL